MKTRSKILPLSIVALLGAGALMPLFFAGCSVKAANYPKVHFQILNAEGNPSKDGYLPEQPNAKSAAAALADLAKTNGYPTTFEDARGETVATITDEWLTNLQKNLQTADMNVPGQIVQVTIDCGTGAWGPGFPYVAGLPGIAYHITKDGQEYTRNPEHRSADEYLFPLNADSIADILANRAAGTPEEDSLLAEEQMSGFKDGLKSSLISQAGKTGWLQPLSMSVDFNSTEKGYAVTFPEFPHTTVQIRKGIHSRSLDQLNGCLGKAKMIDTIAQKAAKGGFTGDIAVLKATLDQKISDITRERGSAPLAVDIDIASEVPAVEFRGSSLKAHTSSMGTRGCLSSTAWLPETYPEAKAGLSEQGFPYLTVSLHQVYASDLYGSTVAFAREYAPANLEDAIEKILAASRDCDNPFQGDETAFRAAVSDYLQAQLAEFEATGKPLAVGVRLLDSDSQNFEITDYLWR